MNTFRYIGPMNQLRGKTGICTALRGQPNLLGHRWVQFDDRALVVNGVAMGYGWQLIKKRYLRGVE